MREVGGSSPSSPTSFFLVPGPPVKSPLADLPIQENIPELLNLDTILTFGPFGESAVLTADDPSTCNLLSYAAGRGHREFRCLSRTHNPSSCVPCTDFSPWLRERVLRDEVEGLSEYLWRVRRADPSVEGDRRADSAAVQRSGAVRHVGAAVDNISLTAPPRPISIFG